MNELFRREDRVALVTGAASGIGAATALALARCGANVVLAWHDADPHDVDPVTDAVRACGRAAVPVVGDVSRVADVDGMIDAAIGTFGRLDIVVANAGVAREVPSDDLSDEEWHALLDVNLLGVFRCFRGALPHMRRARWGRLLATSSIAGAVHGWPAHVHYTAAKAAIVGLVRSLALETAADGITVNAVAPGVIVSPQTLDDVNSLGDQGLRDFKSRVPVGRNGQPDDVAASFAFLASEEASFVTGHTLVVDGGLTILT